MNKLYLFLSWCTCVALFSACQSSDEQFDNKSYISGTTMRNEIVVKRCFTKASLKTLNVSLAKPAEKDITIHYVVESSLVSNYNKAYGEEAELLPDSCYTLKSTTATIPQGGVKSDDITIEFSKLDDIKGNRVCVLPVKAQSNDIELVQSQKVFYYVFRQEH